MRADLMEAYVREKHCLPPEWQGFRFESYPKAGWKGLPRFKRSRYVEIEGAVAPPFVRGPKKGRPNWKRLDKNTLLEDLIVIEEYEAWLEKRNSKPINSTIA